MADLSITQLYADHPLETLSLDMLMEFVDTSEAVASDRNKGGTLDKLLVNTALTTGTSSNYAATISAYPTDSYSDFVPFFVRIHTNSATSAPTLNVNALGGKTVVTWDNLALNTLYADSYLCCVYDTSLDKIKVLFSSRGFNDNVTTSSAGTFSLSRPGKYVHSGTGSTWTLTAGSTALIGKEFDLFNDGSDAIVMAYSGSDTAVSTFGGNIDPGSWAVIYWSGTKWIVKQ